MRRALQMLLSISLTTAAACSDGAAPYRTPTQPELSGAPSPLPAEFDGIWSGTVALRSVTNVVGIPLENCFAMGLADHFGKGGAVQLTIESAAMTFQRLPDEFGACSGEYRPIYSGDWDIACDFRIPFEVTCGDGTSALAWFPNMEDDSFYDIEARGNREIAFDFVEVFTPVRDNPFHLGSYWVTFRFELSR